MHGLCLLCVYIYVIFCLVYRICNVSKRNQIQQHVTYIRLVIYEIYNTNIYDKHSYNYLLFPAVTQLLSSKLSTSIG